VSVPAIRITRLVKRYGSFTAVDGISLDVEDGAFFGPSTRWSA
jgi:ABC-type multidrug transport system ATPase subunit